MFGTPADEKRCHIGYLLAEPTWGKGYATELVTGLVEALRSEAPMTLLGGVDTKNPASARVLEKAGFRLSAELSDDETSIFALELR